MINQNKFPVCFFGHGSPMNAISQNAYTKAIQKYGESFNSKPECILSISAHWETHGFYYTDEQSPKQIYDMYGFPEDLYQLKYEVSGYPNIFKNIHSLDFIKPSSQLGSQKWGIDHGTWSVLTHFRPQADTPVVQLSLNCDGSLYDHYIFGKKLAAIDRAKVLIIGSGNIVHNLRRFSWEENAAILDWSASFDQWIHQNVSQKKYENIIMNWESHPASSLAVPSLEHFLPFIICLGIASESNLTPQVIFDGIQNASLAMRSYAFK
ncbi:MAG: dioxygenase [Pseudobdellovibrio sp.]